MVYCQLISEVIEEPGTSPLLQKPVARGGKNAVNLTRTLRAFGSESNFARICSRHTLIRSNSTMKSSELARPRIKLIARLLVVPALLIAGYAGMQLAPLVHATATSTASPHGLIAEECPSAYTHC